MYVYPSPAPNSKDSTFERMSEYSISLEKSEFLPTRVNRIEYPALFFFCGCSNFQSL